MENGLSGQACNGWCGAQFSVLVTQPQHRQLCDTVMTYTQPEVCVCCGVTVGGQGLRQFFGIGVIVQWAAAVTCINTFRQSL